MIFDELWRTRRERKKTDKLFERLIAKARKKGHVEEPESLGQEHSMEREIIDDKISFLETLEIQRRAEKFGVPVPPLSDKESWEKGYSPYSIRLTKQAKLRIADEIRKERRARISDRMLWVDYLGPLVSPVTGLVGATIGLVALLRACK